MGTDSFDEVVSLYRQIYDIHNQRFLNDSSYLPCGSNLDDLIGTTKNGFFKIFGVFDFVNLDNPGVKSLRKDSEKLASDMIHQQIILKNNGTLPQPGRFTLDNLLGEDIIYRITTNQNVIIDSAMDCGALISFCPVSGACKANGKYVMPEELDDKVIGKIILPYEQISHTEYDHGLNSEYMRFRSTILDVLDLKKKERSLHPVLFNSYDINTRLELLEQGAIDKYLNSIGASRDDFIQNLASIHGKYAVEQIKN
jgi:hypothetical protein